MESTNEPRQPRGKRVGVLMSDVLPESVRWLWDGLIPLGKVTVLDGDPGLGKSALTLDLAARVSAGLPMEDGPCMEAAGVVLLSAEDGLADTIRPRLDAAGADPSRIVALTEIPDGRDGFRLPILPDDMSIIESEIAMVGAKLVIIDPLMAYLSGKIDSHRDQDARRALAPLTALAERTSAAIMVVRHLNKGMGSNAIYRGGGSIGIIGASRTGLLVARHPDDPDRRVLAVTKSNLAQHPAARVFRTEPAPNGAVRINWLGTSDYAADSLVIAPDSDETGSALAEAKEFLLEALRDGARSAKEISTEAREMGISERTLKRAKSVLAVRSRKTGYDGHWECYLPKRANEAEEGHP